MKNTFFGSCHCGKVSFSLHTNINEKDLVPRSDENVCGFCFKNDGTWVSDPNGKFEILNNATVKNYISPSGSRLWQACFCGECGTLCYGLFENKYAVVRARTLNNIQIDFSQTFATNFLKEGEDAGKERRREKWTPVEFTEN